MRRRGWLLGGAGAAAAAAGLGWQHWQAGRRAPPAAAAEAAGGGLWQMVFPTPDGGRLVMAEQRGRPLLLNFWATWCAPCIEEMPELDRFAREQAGWRVVGLALDGPTPVREFLLRHPVGFAIGLAGFEGTALSRRLGNAQGSLPFTAVFDAEGRVVRRKLGQTSRAELQAWAR